jgi:predicted NAD/FAD-dependent oxidoreductase
MNADSIYDVVIIGAGISGLAAGKFLNDRGINVKILDKGRAVGGRLATKRIEFNNDKLKFDYGARFLEANSNDFKDFINQLLENDIAKIWHVESYNSELDKLDISEKYSGKKSMREIAFYLASGLNISSDTRVELINWDKDEWNVMSRNSFHRAKSLLLTMPNPQSLDLLEWSRISIPHKIRTELETVKYEKSITALLILEGKSGIKGEGGIKFNDGPVSFITDNNLKGISSGQTAVTIEMSYSFSAQYWDSPEEKLAEYIIEHTDKLLDSRVVDYHIHRWRYSRPANFYHKRFEYIEQPGSLYLAGDSFMGNNIESAYLSGMEAAKNLYEKFSYKLSENRIL